MIEPTVQAELRRMSADGARVSDLVRHVRRATGLQAPGVGRVRVMAYLCDTFGLPLSEAAHVGAWVGFSDCDGHLSDDDLEELLGRLIRPEKT